MKKISANKFHQGTITITFFAGIALKLENVGPTFLTKPGALFSKVPVTFRARKAVLCLPGLYSRSKFCLF